MENRILSTDEKLVFLYNAFAYTLFADEDGREDHVQLVKGEMRDFLATRFSRQEVRQLFPIEGIASVNNWGTDGELDTILALRRSREFSILFRHQWSMDRKTSMRTVGVRRREYGAKDDLEVTYMWVARDGRQPEYILVNMEDENESCIEIHKGKMPLCWGGNMGMTRGIWRDLSTRLSSLPPRFRDEDVAYNNEVFKNLKRYIFFGTWPETIG